MLPSSAALAVCLWGIQDRPVWRDEHATWWAATLPWDALLRLLSHVDAVIAPYYLLIRVQLSVAGESALALRVPSALAMGLCAGTLALVGARLFNARVGAIAGLVLATIPKVSRYGQEARPYAFALLFTVASVALLQWALDRPRRGRFVAYGASVALLGAAHLVALCSLIAHPILLVERDPESGRLRLRAEPTLGALLALLLALLLLAPLAYLGTQQVAQIAWTSAHDPGVHDLPGMLFGAPGLGRMVLLMGLCALWRPARERLFVGAWAILPLGLLYLSHPILHLFIHRYVLFVLPAWCLLLAVTLEDLGTLLARLTRVRWLPYLLAALLLGLLARRGWARNRALRAPVPASRGYDYVGVAAELRRRSRPEDAVAFAGAHHAAPDWARMAMHYELRDRPPLRDVFTQASAAEIGWLHAEPCQQPAACLPADIRRLWLINCTDETDVLRHLPEAMATLLSDAFEVREVTSLHHIKLALLARRPGR